MTLAEFAEVFAVLAMQLRQTDADEATIRAYYAALKDVEPDFLRMAALRLATDAAWFPKTSEWRALAATIERERVEAQRALLRDLPVALCAACDDTGWTRDADNRVSRCGCQQVRRLEVRGRRPWPAVSEHRRLGTHELVDPADTAALMTQIEQQTGLTITPRSMPETIPVHRIAPANAADQLKALNTVMSGIADSVRRCEALEREMPAPGAAAHARVDADSGAPTRVPRRRTARMTKRGKGVRRFRTTGEHGNG
jgi:hypothetical protein